MVKTLPQVQRPLLPARAGVTSKRFLQLGQRKAIGTVFILVKSLSAFYQLTKICSLLPVLFAMADVEFLASYFKVPRSWPVASNLR